MGEDWVYLALLGVIMAILSYVMDKGIAMCTNGKHRVNNVRPFANSLLVILHLQPEYGCTET